MVLTIPIFTQFAEGNCFETQLTLTEALINSFALLSGDNNPIHMNASFAQEKGFKTRVSHGNILGMMISQLVGTQLPTQDVLLISQSIQYKKPIYGGMPIRLVGTVVTCSESVRIVELSLIFLGGSQETVAKGKCAFKVL